MTDARLTLSYEGIGAEFASFNIDNSEIVYDSTKVGGSASVGLAVALTSDHTVDLAADAESILGKLILVEADGVCTVQYDGMTSLPAGTGATCTAGKHQVGALGPTSAKGYVRDQASTAEDAASNTRCIDASGAASNGPVVINLE